MKKFRFRSVVSLANSKLSIKLAAIVLASSTLVSALLGIFRDRLLNGYYLDTYKTGIDAYTVAFTVPDFMFFILVSGALSVTFIPVFNQRLVSGNKKSAWELSSSMLNLLALVTLITSILIIIFAEPLVRYVVGPGLDEASRALAVSMMRVIAVNPFLFAIATVISSMQQALGRFVFYAMAPAVYNIGIIIGTVFFTGGINIFGWQIFEGGIMGVALGVALGSVLQLLVSVVGLIGLGFDYEFKIYWKNQGFRKTIGLLPARSLDQGMDYVNSIVETNMASRMAPGSARSFQQAMSLHQMPVNLIGVAISTAFFPKMTEDLGEGKEEIFKKDMRQAIRMIVWLALPVALLAFITRGYLVNFIKNGGDTLISGIFAFLVVSLFCRSVFHILSRGFYAKQDTKTPFIVSLVAIGLNIGLAILFSLVFKMGPYGLAIAESGCAALEIGILMVILSKRLKGLFNMGFWRAIFRMAVATLLTGAVAYLITSQVIPLSGQSFFTTFPQFGLIGLVSAGVYIMASYLFRLDEVQPVIARIKSFLFGSIKKAE